MSSEMRFCSECNNLLYPRENKLKRKLIFVCRHCDFTYDADPTETEQNCIEKINFNFQSKENLMISKELSKDPTLGRTHNWKCSMCGNKQAVYFQLPERLSEDAMALVYICCNDSCEYWEKQKKYDETENLSENDNDDTGVDENDGDLIDINHNDIVDDEDNDLLDPNDYDDIVSSNDNNPHSTINHILPNSDISNISSKVKEFTTHDFYENDFDEESIDTTNPTTFHNIDTSNVLNDVENDINIVSNDKINNFIDESNALDETLFGEEFDDSDHETILDD